MSYLTNSFVFGVAFDTDAQNFITTAGITDTTQKNAINTLVVNLKAYSIWSKIVCLYPFIGGTSTTHKYNLINPSLYQITWAGGTIVHSSNGVKFNATSSSYGDTGLKPSNFGSQNNRSYGLYFDNTTRSVLSHWLGINYTNRLYPSFQLSTTALNYSISSSSQGGYTIASNPVNQLVTVTRSSSTVAELYLSGTMVDNDSVTSTTIPDINVFIGASNGNTGVGISPSDIRIKFAFFGSNLTATDVSNLNTIVTNYQTAIGR